MDIYATYWYLIGCASGAGAAIFTVILMVIAAWPDLKISFRSRG